MKRFVITVEVDPTGSDIINDEQVANQQARKVHAALTAAGVKSKVIVNNDRTGEELLELDTLSA